VSLARMRRFQQTRLTFLPLAYDVEVLRAAAKAAGQTVDPNGDQTLLYDAIYNCQAGGAIAWNRYCGKGKCDAGLQVPNANCRA